MQTSDHPNRHSIIILRSFCCPRRYLQGLWGGLAILGLAGWTWPGTVARWRDEARVQYQAGQYAAADQSYVPLEEMLPNSPEVSYNRGNTLYRLQRYEEAVQAYQRAQQRDASRQWTSQLHYNRGNAFFRLNRLKESEEACGAAVEAARAAGIRDADAEYNLALVRRLLRHPASALPSLPGESGDPEGRMSSRPGTPSDGTEGSGPAPDKSRDNQHEKREDRASRPRRPPEYGLTEQEVDRLLKQLEADERQLQRYFNRRPRFGAKRSRSQDLRGSPRKGPSGGSEDGVGKPQGKDW